ncbi:RagB/SusD family nutrient uptake outer membrane protein [Plebeiibacterium sediminum]|uniref:RagB/SusD family nutrient uptake outer membrane protein n=1 Tax=Plebeiibacterium sediminum TaxID=2992112 RepID=A0AAE3M3G2_9BACT|nr:RagB/SusD family nutrient uptake outer membrane protein [Plebeiobacterium sediminum]MCW3786419.1 RagB/SusD family nutrient uptake outer membrane protein [Plebeiobacterium sediminum]
MKKILNIVMLSCIALLTVTGCDDFLDADNKSNVTSDEYFNTEAGFETLINYAYAQLKPLYNASPTMQCSGTDMYHRGRNSMPDTDLQIYSSLNAENGTVNSFYVNCYRGIQAANCALFYANSVDADDNLVSKRSQEARFIRAYFYFELVQHFGGVAIVDEYISSIVTTMPRNTLEETYSFIISEMEAIVGSGSALEETDLNGRITKQAVYHYLAKVYLTAGWDLNNNTYFTTAANYAQQAIALGSGLDETYADLWDPSRDNMHQEVVFALQYDRISSGAAGLSETSNGNQLQTPFGSYYGGEENHYKYSSSNFCPSEHLMYLYEPGDSRYEATYMTKLYCTDVNDQYSGDYYAPYNGTAEDDDISYYYPAHYQSSADDIAAWRNEDLAHRASTKVIPMTSITLSTDEVTPYTYYEAATLDVFGLTCIRKFDDPESSFNNNTCYRDIVLARLGETYLIAAEAYLEAGGHQAEVDQMVNTVRERAYRGSGLTASEYEKSNVDLDDILDERALELAGERLRWCDLRRTKKLVEYNIAYNPELINGENSFNGADGNQKLYRPIPQNAINLNDAEIEQNPGY